MFGAEIAVGYVFAWAVRKARRVAGAADAVVDETLDATVERVHQVVSERLGTSPALARVEEEAASGAVELSGDGQQFLRLTLEHEAGRDAAFARLLEEAVTAARAAEQSRGPAFAAGDGIAVAGNVDLKAEGGSVAALRVGNVTFGAPPAPEPPTAPR